MYLILFLFPNNSNRAWKKTENRNITFRSVEDCLKDKFKIQMISNDSAARIFHGINIIRYPWLLLRFYSRFLKVLFEIKGKTANTKEKPYPRSFKKKIIAVTIAAAERLYIRELFLFYAASFLCLLLIHFELKIRSCFVPVFISVNDLLSIHL